MWSQQVKFTGANPAGWHRHFGAVNAMPTAVLVSI
jgi:hypothetical protein